MGAGRGPTHRWRFRAKYRPGPDWNQRNQNFNPNQPAERAVSVLVCVPIALDSEANAAHWIGQGDRDRMAESSESQPKQHSISIINQ